MNTIRHAAIKRMLEAINCTMSASEHDEDLALADALTELESAHRMLQDELQAVTSRRGREFLSRVRSLEHEWIEMAGPMTWPEDEG